MDGLSTTSSITLFCLWFHHVLFFIFLCLVSLSLFLVGFFVCFFVFFIQSLLELTNWKIDCSCLWSMPTVRYQQPAIIKLRQKKIKALSACVQRDPLDVSKYQASISHLHHHSGERGSSSVQISKRQTSPQNTAPMNSEMKRLWGTAKAVGTQQPTSWLYSEQS